MYIGEFCKLTQTTPKTIRYYESLGLLPAAQRLGKYRSYDDTYVETVKQIKIAQQLGFRLKELQQWFSGADSRRGLPEAVIRAALQQKRADIARQKQQLQEMEQLLDSIEGSLSC